MFCPNCGKDCGNAKFCPECGTNLQDIDPQIDIMSKAEPPKDTPYVSQTPKMLTRRAIVVILCFIIAAAAVTGGLMIYHSRSTPMTSSSAVVAIQNGVLTTKVTISKDFMSMISDLSQPDSSNGSVLSTASDTYPDGVLAVEKHSDGSVTITMTKTRYTQMMDDMKKDIEKSMAQFTSSGASIENITANEKMSDFQVTVDKAKYEQSIDAIYFLGIYMQSGLYQEFEGIQSPSTTFHLIDKSNGKEFATIRYPEDMQQSKSQSVSVSPDVSSSISSASQTAKQAVLTGNKSAIQSSSSKATSASKSNVQSQNGVIDPDTHGKGKYDKGFKEGREDGEKDGESDGYNEMIGTDNYVRAYTLDGKWGDPDRTEEYAGGYEDGYDEGYNDGYSKGARKAAEELGLDIYHGAGPTESEPESSPEA